MKHFVDRFGNQSPTVHGLIVSSILIPAAVSSFFAGFLADRLGRPKGISIGALIFGIGAALEAAAVHLGMLSWEDVLRVLARVYIWEPWSCRFNSVYSQDNTLMLSRYICEISPTSVRGTLTTGPQLLITLGLVTGLFTCYGCSRIDSSFSWRTPFIILACLSAIFSMASFLWLIPSPRWLTLHGRQSEATDTWDMLGVGLAEREKVEIEDSWECQGQTTAHEAGLQNEDRTAVPHPAKKSTRHALFDLFSRDVRTRTALTVFLMGMQQLSGIDGVLYVSLVMTGSYPTRISLTNAVCSFTLRTGRSCFFRSQLLCIRSIRHCHLRSHHPSPHLGR